MGPWEWFVIFAVCGLIVAAATHWNRSDDSRTYRDAWQESAAAAAREPITPPEDPATAAEIALLYEMCPDVTRVIALPNPRRTEEDQ
jgi:hypothetical protein